MKIGLDIRFLHYGLARKGDNKNIGGIGVYQKNLLLNLLDIDSENHYYLLIHSHLSPKPIEELVQPKKNVSILPLMREIYLPFMDSSLGIKIRALQRRFIHNRTLESAGLDVVHFSGERDIGTKPSEMKVVITIYDVIHELLSKKGEAFGRRLNTRTSKNVELADHIFAISEATKNDLIEHFGAKAEKITVTYLDCDRKVFYPRPQNEIDTVKAKYKIQSPYFIHVGSIYASKNTERIVRAFAAAKREIKTPMFLYFAGVMAKYGKPEVEEFYRVVREEEAESYIQLLPPVTDNELSALYTGSVANLHPSLYEGFGMTLLEAMASGTAVITSNTSSMPEVVGDAGIVVNPEETKEVKDAIEKLTIDGIYRKLLINKTNEQLEKFSWKYCANIAIETIKYNLFI
ncbi:MAG: glycosyltransferase family 1 protein [Chloroherpetonaceae bacterium]|nr:glycosyltransferase family 1 protein [Chloroherpetonaceae bacterium]